MEISGVVSALVVGVVVGALGRLVVPGRQRFGPLWTVVVGIAAALLGTALARVTGLADTSGPDWTEWLAQVLLAALGVAALTRVKGLD
ncbi:GlsB/YeaQ/YmgE family stress response membrane protein [Streptomyces cinereoruber]|uniref:GlsB/YeaQ/YmgE family stress response membrane protein n=1 Tax=Streptomyces cinereoruber TaxID=67260 RepID=UPI003394630B